MPGFRYTPQSETRSRAAQVAARRAPTPPAAADITKSIPQQKNVKQVLSLGEVRYMSVRGLGTFAIPPVPFKTGQRVMELYTNALSAAHVAQTIGTKESHAQYFAYLSQLARILHQHIRPIGIVHRSLWRIGLSRNRFRQCSEQELKDIAGFFLQGRMRSSVQFTSVTEIA